jgi:protein tyrosine/serine phosphatase
VPYELATGKEAAPAERSYWVVPRKLAGGAYPPLDGQRIERLIEAGIRTFINLVEENERNLQGQPFTRYADHARELARARGEQVACLGFPVRDLSIPSRERMRSILDAIDLSLAANRPVFVHCYGGIGRTGTVIGCWLRRHGLASADEVLSVLATLRQADAIGRQRRAPETAEQVEMVLSWREGE